MEKRDFFKTLIETTRGERLIKSMYMHSPYCMSVNDNIYPAEMEDRFMRMFINGRGNELAGKACAIHSSSMFAFNFYHWISENTPFYFENYIFTKVYFEVQLPTLRGTTPANMDVVLEGTRNEDGKKTLLFIESKFTEHSKNASSDIKKMETNSYSVRENKYYSYNAERFKKWIEVIGHFIERSKSEVGYFDGIKQEICHMIALSNLKHDSEARENYEKRYQDICPEVDHPEINGSEVFLFYNVLFDASHEYNAGNAFEMYTKLYNDFTGSLDGLSDGISCDILSYKKIYDSITDKDLKDYLEKRYMQFAKH